MASFSLSLGDNGSKNRKPSPPPPRSGTKRTYAALDDAESEEEDITAGKQQNITHFDLSAGGAVDAAKPKVVKEALVIWPQANRDWKEASARNRKKPKYGLSSEDQQKAQDDFVPPPASTAFGLNIPKSGTNENSANTQSTADVTQTEVIEHVTSEVVPTKPKTDDERAIAALMGFKEESTLTIPTVTEEEALERDVKEAPDAPTLAKYAAVPVEEFGAAMLRGMGWKEGQGIGAQKGQKMVKVKVPERRPALLGIGAKPDAAVAAELGAWGAGAKGRKRVDIVYNPLVLKNAKTGEHLTEEELKSKLQEQKEREANDRYMQESDRDRDHRHREQPSKRSERDKRYSEDRNHRVKEHRRERDHGDDRHRSRRERSTSYEKHRLRRDGSVSHDRTRDKRRDRIYDDHRDKDRHRDSRDDQDHRRSRRDRDYHDDKGDRRRRRPRS